MKNRVKKSDVLLEDYRKKRDFTTTNEPGEGNASSNNRLAFVVQRHAARRLHYDFRLELEGVLKSWAVPKGPSLNPSDKRLAVMVEDHPYSYRTFEGTIPKGNYGAGEVVIWDKGYYEPLIRPKGKGDEEVLLEGLKKGSLKFVIHGEKLKGEFVLVKMQGTKEENAWLLIKHDDSYATTEPYDAESFSHTSGRSGETKQVEGASVTPVHPVISEASTTSAAPATDSRKNKAWRALGKQPKLPDYIKPMLAITADEPFDSDEWVFEIKWDGYRAIADLTGDLQFYSRNGLSFLGKYDSIEEGLARQEHPMILDGEIVAYDSSGEPRFQSLQHYADSTGVTLIYHVFDLLHLNGHSTRELSLLERKELLREALVETANVKYCDHVENSGKQFYDAARKTNLEGIMAKKKSSIYRDGKRGEEWLKIKNHSDIEAVIAGYTEPRGSRKYFGSLILGRYHEGELVYAGHVGTGFNEQSLKEIHSLLQPLVTEAMPFKQKPATNMPPTWVKPEVVCTVKFSEVTADGLFRHPVFIAIRDDKNAGDLKKVTGDLEESVDDLEKVADDLEKVEFTNTDKLYWKKEKITKGNLIDYYLSISDYILPHLKGRAQSLHRFPEGIEGDSFYHKNAGKDAPSWVETVTLFSESNSRDIEYIVCNDKDTLGYLINLGCIELNPWSNLVGHPGMPDWLIIDLDPSEKNSFKEVVEAAQTTREVLDASGVVGYCKTSGSTGIHIFIPMGGEYSYDQVRDFAHILMQLVRQRLPKTTSLERSLKKRGPKIYLDWLQNREGQTVASVYSARPKPGATVSMPIEWSELAPDLSIQDFTIHNVLDRLSEKGDIFLPVLQESTDIEKAISKLQELR